MKKRVFLFAVFCVLMTATGFAAAEGDILVCIDSACTSGYTESNANVHSDGTSSCSFFIKNNTGSTINALYYKKQSGPDSIAAGETAAITLEYDGQVNAGGQIVNCLTLPSSPIWTPTPVPTETPVPLDTPVPAETPVPDVVIYPEDEIGAYYINEEGVQIYNWFNKYSICMYFMGDEAFCERFPL